MRIDLGSDYVRQADALQPFGGFAAKWLQSFSFGQREIRTPDTRIFSPLLYRLSYLAPEHLSLTRKIPFGETTVKNAG
jgi:hypothetical protein